LDDRFHLDKIPEFNRFENNHVQPYIEDHKQYSKLICRGKGYVLFAPGGVRAAKHQPVEHTKNYSAFSSS